MKNKILYTAVTVMLLIIFAFITQSVTPDGNANETSVGIAADSFVEIIGETSESFSETEEASPQLYFRTEKLLNSHYEKHGREMGFETPEEYEKSASDAANDPNALHKTETEDGDDVYYLEDTNEFVVVSADGYIRTYFLPDKGKSYYDKQ